MTVPTNSTGPAAPSASSFLRPVASIVEWFGYIRAWIIGLSPSGSDRYETAWTNIPVGAGFTQSGQAPQFKRVGKVYYFRGDIGVSSGSMTAGAAHSLSGVISDLAAVPWRSTVRAGWGPNAGGAVRLFIEAGIIKTYIPAGQTAVNYVSLSGLSGLVVE